jgi:hypothetical protein
VNTWYKLICEGTFPMRSLSIFISYCSRRSFIANLYTYIFLNLLLHNKPYSNEPELFPCISLNLAKIKPFQINAVRFNTVKRLLTFIRSSAFNKQGGYVGGWVGAWRHLGYGVPELPLSTAALSTPLACWPLRRVTMDWMTFQGTGFENRLSGRVYT